MDDDEGYEPIQRPPILLGCGLMALLVVAVAFIGGFCVVFLESGTDAKAVLDVPARYGIGTVTFVPDENVYLVRLADGTFVALSDLDAYNRARPGARCRVSPIGTTDPELARLLQEHRDEFSPAASAANYLFRDPCAGTLYDITGVRVGTPGPNLDRHEVGIDEKSGKVTVDVANRICTTREGSDYFAPVECPE
ncbi:MAG: hypothetical protein IT303_15475 [Dehalococcoidia bacterium]|nr:hypothetical protein [Dehalococcoidia bacterium]